MRIAVVGGGPAGMMAAIAAGEQGADVTLFDGNEKLGKKLYITGKGRCNVTNDADSDAFFKNIPRNPRFLYSCYAAFDNRALMKRIEDAGVPLKVERGGRVFPQSDKASDITKALERMMSKSGVRVCLRSKVKEILPSDGGFDLCLPGQTRHSDRVILARGGALLHRLFKSVLINHGRTDAPPCAHIIIIEQIVKGVRIRADLLHAVFNINQRQRVDLLFPQQRRGEVCGGIG